LQSEVVAGQMDGGVDQVMAGFSRFRTFRELFCLVGPAISGVQTGFSRFGMLREKFVDLGRNSERKSVIPREIQGIRARKFVEM
jgi:hypothetical protein